VSVGGDGWVPSSETRIISPSSTHNHMHLKIPLRIVCSATLVIQLALHTKQLIPEPVHLAIRLWSCVNRCCI